MCVVVFHYGICWFVSCEVGPFVLVVGWVVEWLLGWLCGWVRMGRLFWMVGCLVGCVGEVGPIG